MNVSVAQGKNFHVNVPEDQVTNIKISKDPAKIPEFGLINSIQTPHMYHQHSGKTSTDFRVQRSRSKVRVFYISPQFCFRMIPPV